MKHYINLMNNGDLVYTDFLIESDDKLKKSWNYIPENRSSAYYIILSAFNENADKKQIKNICEEWNISTEDTKIFAKKIGIEIFENIDGYIAKWKDNNAETLPKETVFEALSTITKRYKNLFETKAENLLK